MKDSNERWRGTVTGTATYETHHLDSFNFLKKVMRAPLGEGTLTFSAKLLDDPSPKPVIHEFTAHVDRIDFLSGGQRVALVGLVRDDGTHFHMLVLENTDAVRFELIT